MHAVTPWERGFKLIVGLHTHLFIDAGILIVNVVIVIDAPRVRGRVTLELDGVWSRGNDGLAQGNVGL